MIEQVHQHIVSELHHLLTLAINSDVARGEAGTAQTIVMIIR